MVPHETQRQAGPFDGEHTHTHTHTHTQNTHTHARARAETGAVHLSCVAQCAKEVV